ncbi:MAG TPA: hypothetical protein VE988_09290 [Gemmataceae bacterium]|nr:hypothetical protein [Gemmataceae bacterium]
MRRCVVAIALFVSLSLVALATSTERMLEPNQNGPQDKQPPAKKKQRAPALMQDYVKFTVTAPPAELKLDPFYKKYVDALGIPVCSSEKVPDQALLMARDIVNFMLSDRPDLRKELIRMKWKIAIMAETEVTYDIPEHRKYRLLPKIDDERLTPAQKANYNKPGGVGSMTGEQYWNSRGRGFGGEPDGENTTSCAEENLLGYPGTRYFGESLLVHEFSHGIMRGAIYKVDPKYKQAVVDAYENAKKNKLRTAQGYYGNNFNEYWAGGIEAYTHSTMISSNIGPTIRTRQALKDTDPRLFELVTQVIPAGKITGNIFAGRVK